MTNVVDSLKRLERVGSESSKTTEKLIHAAQELSEKIVTIFAPMDHEAIDIGMNYMIRGGTLVNEADSRFVGTNRETAFLFARDVANGLLDQVADALAKRNEENQVALAILEGALRKT